MKLKHPMALSVAAFAAHAALAGTHTASATEFTCATSMSAAALKVHGELVKLDAK